MISWLKEERVGAEGLIFCCLSVVTKRYVDASAISPRRINYLFILLYLLICIFKVGHLYYVLFYIYIDFEK